MKVRLDEHLSYRVANAIKALLADRTGLTVDWVRDEHPPGTLDSNWIRKFADDGGHAFLSGDFRILQHWPDLIAYIESGLVSFFPPPGFDRLKGYGQASLIIRWWPAVIEKVKISQRGDCWRIPMEWTPDVTKFKKLEDPRLRTKEQKLANRIRPLATIHQFRGKG